MVELVAEIGINHNGDLDIAKKLIDVAAAAGCQYVKFQKRNVDLVYTPEELAAPRESPFGKTNGDLKRGLEFGQEEFDEIDYHCLQRGIEWFASPWDIDSVHFLATYPNCKFIKIASAMLTNKNLLHACLETGRPIILSTGMSTTEEIDNAVYSCSDALYAILHCTSTYPSKPEELNLSFIPKLKQYGYKVGFSNHYPGLSGMVMAYCYGAEMIEMHITLSRAMWGSDQAASIEPRGLFDLAQRLKIMEQMKGDGTKKIYDSEIPIMRKLRR